MQLRRRTVRQPSCSSKGPTQHERKSSRSVGGLAVHFGFSFADRRPKEVDLATRVALLEAKLTLMNDISNGTNRKSSSETDSTCSKNSGDSPDSTSDALRYVADARCGRFRSTIANMENHQGANSPSYHLNASFDLSSIPFFDTAKISRTCTSVKRRSTGDSRRKSFRSIFAWL